MKVGDYIICKSIPKDSFLGSLTVGKVYKIESIANEYNHEGKVYFIFANDYHPYLILDSKLNDNFEPIRNRNLDLLLNNTDDN